MSAASRNHFALVEKWMHLDLVGHQWLGCKLRRLVQELGGKVCDSNMPGLSLALGLAQRPDGFGKRHFRIGPMDQQEIDEREPKLPEALVQRTLEVGGGELVVIDLCGHEDVVAFEAGGR